MTLEAPEHKEMNGRVEVTWRILRTIENSLMIHVRVLVAYIHFELMYMTDHNFLVLIIKDLINKNGDPTMPFKLATGTRPLVSHLRVFFCPRVVRKATTHVGEKTLNMRHQSQKDFCSIFIGNTQNQRGYLVYVPHKRKIISSYDFF